MCGGCKRCGQLRTVPHPTLPHPPAGAPPPPPSPPLTSLLPPSPFSSPLVQNAPGLHLLIHRTLEAQAQAQAGARQQLPSSPSTSPHFSASTPASILAPAQLLQPLLHRLAYSTAPKDRAWACHLLHLTQQQQQQQQQGHACRHTPGQQQQQQQVWHGDVCMLQQAQLLLQAIWDSPATEAETSGRAHEGGAGAGAGADDVARVGAQRWLGSLAASVAHERHVQAMAR